MGGFPEEDFWPGIASGLCRPTPNAGRTLVDSPSRKSRSRASEIK
jgi:hypothetical protein